MKKITYLKGDATSPQAKGIKIICHICNDLGGWGKGFVMAVSKRWPEAEKQYRHWHRHRAKNNFALGQVQFVQVTEYLHIANMIGQRGMKTGSKGPPIRYEAVKECLVEVAKFAIEHQASIHMPRIGCGLAGGKWNMIEAIINETLLSQNLSVFVYDCE